MTAACAAQASGEDPDEPAAVEAEGVPIEQLQAEHAAMLAALGGGSGRARSHCRFAQPLILFIPDSLTYSVPLFMKRQRDRTPGSGSGGSGKASRPSDRAVYTVAAELCAKLARDILAGEAEVGPAPRRARFTNIFGAFVSETSMRPLLLVIPDSVTYSVPLSLRRGRDRTPGGRWAAERLRAGLPARPQGDHDGV